MSINRVEKDAANRAFDPKRYRAGKSSAYLTG